MPTTSRIASLNFSGVGLKLTCCQPLASRAFQSQVTQIRVHQNRRFWGVFFFSKNRFTWPNGQFLPITCHTYSESYWSDGSFGTSGNPLRASCDPHIFRNIVIINWQYWLKPCLRTWNKSLSLNPRWLFKEWKSSIERASLERAVSKGQFWGTQSWIILFLELRSPSFFDAGVYSVFDVYSNILWTLSREVEIENSLMLGF